VAINLLAEGNRYGEANVFHDCARLTGSKRTWVLEPPE